MFRNNFRQFYQWRIANSLQDACINICNPIPLLLPVYTREKICGSVTDGPETSNYAVHFAKLKIFVAKHPFCVMYVQYSAYFLIVGL
jgi:hypothetical protein